MGFTFFINLNVTHAGQRGWWWWWWCWWWWSCAGVARTADLHSWNCSCFCWEFFFFFWTVTSVVNLFGILFHFLVWMCVYSHRHSHFSSSFHCESRPGRTDRFGLPVLSCSAYLMCNVSRRVVAPCFQRSKPHYMRRVFLWHALSWKTFILNMDISRLALKFACTRLELRVRLKIRYTYVI